MIKSLMIFKQFSKDSGATFPVKDTLLLYYHEEYDSLGNITHRVLRGTDVFDNSYFHNIYNSSGLLASRYSLYKNEGEIVTRDTFVYNTKGLLIKETEILHPDEIRGITEYEYNSSGQVISETYIGTGNYRQETKYKYLDNKLVQEEDGISLSVYTYDQLGKLLKGVKIWKEKGDTAWIDTYHYNKRGDLKIRATKNKSLSPEEADQYTISYYDSWGNIISEWSENSRRIFRYEFWD